MFLKILKYLIEKFIELFSLLIIGDKLAKIPIPNPIKNLPKIKKLIQFT